MGQSGRRVSNPRPSAWEADALPTELRPRRPSLLGSGADSNPRIVAAAIQKRHLHQRLRTPCQGVTSSTGGHAGPRTPARREMRATRGLENHLWLMHHVGSRFLDTRHLRRVAWLNFHVCMGAKAASASLELSLHAASGLRPQARNMSPDMTNVSASAKWARTARSISSSSASSASPIATMCGRMERTRSARIERRE